MKNIANILINWASMLPLFAIILAFLFVMGKSLHETHYIPYLKQHFKGGLGSELAKEMDVDRADLAKTLSKTFHFAVDSLSKYHHFIGIFINEQMVVDVGMKVDKITGETNYLARDGKYYPAITSRDSLHNKRMYYVDRSGKSKWIEF